jgi:hypothetical protein
MLISVEGTGKNQVQPGQDSIGGAAVLSHLLLLVLVRDQIRNMVEWIDRQITFGRINYKFRTSSDKNAGQYKIYWNTGESVDLKAVVVVVVVVLLSL